MQGNQMIKGWGIFLEKERRILPGVCIPVLEKVRKT